MSLIFRKGGLIFNDFVGLVGAALMGLSHMATSFEMLIIGRLVIGYNCGKGVEYKLVEDRPKGIVFWDQSG